VAGERDLDRLLGGMAPRRAPGTYVFATVPDGEVPAGLTSGFPAARITLLVHSDLAAVGLTAVVSTALAELEGLAS
jgi:uncharacterized protein